MNIPAIPIPIIFIFNCFSETGIIGFGFVSFVYISLILYIFYFRFIKNNLSNIKILFFGTILIHLFPFVPSGNFFNNFNNMIFYYPLKFFNLDLYQRLNCNTLDKCHIGSFNDLVF